MTQALESDLAALRSSFAGQVITASDTDYDSARSLWNGCFDHHPAVITRCFGAADVTAAIAFARERDLEISVRGGGHSFSGVSSADGSLMIDLSQLREVVVDPAARRVSCGGGTTGADLDAACQQHGLAVTAGLVSHTGIAGLTLGGGFGWLSSMIGLSIDNLAGAEVVLAASSIIAADLSAPPAPFVPEQYHFALGNALIVAGFSSAEQHKRLIEPIRAALPPLLEFVTPMPYTALQQMLDDTAPWGIHAYDKSLYLDTLSNEAIEVVAKHIPGKNSPMSFMPVIPLGGAYQDVEECATAFGGTRTARFNFDIAANPKLLAADRAWAQALWNDLLPHANKSAGYVNFMSEYEQDRVQSTYGPAKYERLARIKADYDADNVFHLNANIKPAP